MSAEAIAGLLRSVRWAEKRGAIEAVVSTADLRALLDAYDALEANRDELHAEMNRQNAHKKEERQAKLDALDSLEQLRNAHKEALEALKYLVGFIEAGCNPCDDDLQGALRVLRKAGRR